MLSYKSSHPYLTCGCALSTSVISIIFLGRERGLMQEKVFHCLFPVDSTIIIIIHPFVGMDRRQASVIGMFFFLVVMAVMVGYGKSFSCVCGC